MRTVIGVMGSGQPLSKHAYDMAYRLGALIAKHGWMLLTGGTASGVMDAASRGAHEAGGLVIGVLRGPDGAEASSYVDVGIRTGMGDARNVINVLSSDVVVALPGGPGTLSEVALALKNRRPVIVVGWDPGPAIRASGHGRLFDAQTAEDAVEIAQRVLLGDV